MTFKFSRFAIVAFVSAVFVASAFVNILGNGNTVFAEGDYVGPGSVNCGGKIMGKTVAQNPNFGRLDFDSHPGLDTTGSPTDLSIVGLAPGLAPANRYVAACVDASVAPIVDPYMLKGYAWNTNLGFYSFYCDATKNLGVDCGAFNYGVKVAAPVGGFRKLSGHAWNPAFGYMQFSGQGNQGGVPFNYDVVADVDGKLSGWAWTEAKVWVNMAGVVIQIPGQKIVAPVVGVCDGKPFACIEVVTDPEKGLAKVLSGTNGTGGIKTGLENDNEVKVANGVDGYEIHLYLRDADGVTPMDTVNKYTLGNMKFTWVDSVKRTQDFTNSVGGSLDAVSNPWAQGKGGIFYKPTSNVTLADFFDVVAPGHYKLKKNIQSYAPTTDMNVSYTVSMKPNVPFQNETFFSKMKTFGNQIPKPEPNRLKLSNVDVPVTVKATGAVPTFADGKIYSNIIYPNGKDGLFFHFRPAVEVNTLYSGNNQDSISGFRSIPFSFMATVAKHSSFDNNSTTKVNFKLDYDEETTISKCSADGLDATGGFDVGFVGANSSIIDVVSDPYTVELSALAALKSYDEITDEEVKAAVKPCTQAQGPSLYSVAQYTVDQKEVTYFSNHLPRTVTSITNPVAVVRGNLYAAKAFSPSAAVETQETGSKSVNIVRDGVYENITSKISGVTLKKDPNPSGTNSTVNVVNSNPSGSVDVDGTKVVVYENKDVHIALTTAASYANNQTIVVMNGNVFIDKDIYKVGSTDKMQIIVLRPYSSGCNKGNIYVKNTVRNINANVFTDCSIFSYKAGMAFDPATGVPVWANFSEMTDSLNKQLRWFGSIASHNTVGGSDLDKDTVNPKTYLLDGFRAWDASKLTDKDKLAIQAYDLNYLRLFKLSVQTNDLEQLVDQSCKKGLTLDEMLLIAQGQAGEDVEPVYGDAVDENGDKIPCNGIDPLSPYDAESGEGDLIAPIGDTSTLAQGLTAGNYDPVYVIFSPSTSPLFRN